MKDYFLELDKYDKYRLKSLSLKLKKAVNNLFNNHISDEDIIYLCILEEYSYYADKEEFYEN